MVRAPGVYKITNKVNGKFYIGSSVDMQNRCSVHRMRLRKQVHGNPHLQSAWNKYGEENFEFSIVEIVEKREDAVIREQYYLDEYKPPYNIVLRAEATCLGRKLSDEHRNKISKSKLGVYGGENNPFYGKRHTEETKKKISEYRSGRLLSEEHKQAIGNAQIGEKSHYAKLTWDKVNEIRRLYEVEGYCEAELVLMYDMSQSAINKLLNYKTWRLE